MVRLRADLAQERTGTAEDLPGSAPSSERDLLSSMESALLVARGLADVSATPGSMLHGGRVRRELGRFASRTIQALVRNFVGQQSQFNGAVVESLEAIRLRLEAEQSDSSSSPYALASDPDDHSEQRQTAASRSSLFRTLEFSRRFKSVSGESVDREKHYAELFVGSDRILDVACGSGRFLEACGRHDLRASGVDLDSAMIGECRKRGLDVEQADALSYLSRLDDESLNGVFSAQFVEHLAPQQLMQFIALVHQKLAPGGRAVIETLNPECLQVIYRWFWLDPTHRRLVHPWLLEELLSTAGFSASEIHLLPPSADSPRLPPLPAGSPEEEERNAPFNTATNHLNDLVYASTDYYVIATK